MARVIVSEPEHYSERALALYGRLGEVRAERLDDAALAVALADAEVLVIRLRRVTRALIEAAPQLKVIASPTTGLDHIDVAAAEERGVKIVCLRGKREFLDKIYATSELTVGLLLALLRRIPAAHAHVVAGGWDRQQFVGGEISGKTIGIVGLGRLGTRAAAIFQAMGATVIAADPHVAPERVPQGVRLLPLAELLPAADVVSIHVLLTPETGNLIGKKEFAAMKPGAYLINTSRGQIVDEQALLSALESGRLAGAAVDVLAAEEPSGAFLAGHPLRAYAATHDTLLLTPHIGGATRESMALTEDVIAEEVVAFLS